MAILFTDPLKADHGDSLLESKCLGSQCGFSHITIHILGIGKEVNRKVGIVRTVDPYPTQTRTCSSSVDT